MSETQPLVKCINCKLFIYDANISLFGTGLCRAPVPAKCGPETQFSMSMDKDKNRICPSFKGNRIPAYKKKLMGLV
jgi:hypothetical protein